MLQSTKLVISYLGVLTNRRNYWIIWENLQQSQVRSFFAALCRASLNANSKPDKSLQYNRIQWNK